MSDTNREAFETNFTYLSGASLVRNGDGYMATNAAFAWAMWEASRKQTLLDASNTCTAMAVTDAEDYNQIRRDCAEAIKGLK